jgi:lysozyme
MAIRDTFGLATLTAELTTDEGRRQYPYTDTKGYLSCGIGRNLTGKGLREDEIDYLFDNDVAECCAALDRNISWWRQLPATKQRVLINLCFMGWGQLSRFVHFLAAMEAGDWLAAAKELENSDWYRQVHDRGPRVVARLLAGSATS